MNISCDRCGGKNKQNYRTFYLETEKGKSLVTMCYECLDVNPPKMSQKAAWEHINTPYWKLMGLKPKPKDVAYEKQLKRKNMTYGDAALERSLYAQNQSAVKEWENHMNKGGRYEETKYEKRQAA